VSRAFPSFLRSILTDIYLCHACYCHEIEDENAWAGLLRRLVGLAKAPELNWHREELTGVLLRALVFWEEEARPAPRTPHPAPPSTRTAARPQLRSALGWPGALCTGRGRACCVRVCAGAGAVRPHGHARPDGRVHDAWRCDQRRGTCRQHTPRSAEGTARSAATDTCPAITIY
jgi:hypothetical protein